MKQTPKVSIIIPCRNEADFIAGCLDSILANDYPKDRMEILVVDGMNEDGTREIVRKYALNHPTVKLLDNPQKITPAALNIGIKNAGGDIIVRMDAHAQIEKDYISRCVDSLNKYGADNVGGIMKTLPQKDRLFSGAIVVCLSHRFGVGNSYFRIHTDQPRWVDTVFGGCYPKDVFQKVGLYNERLARGQDMEFNLRLKKAGGRILLVPTIVSYYYARTGIKSFWKHNWNNGIWAVLPFAYSDVIPVSWRHLVPLIFMASLLGSAVLGFLTPVFLWLCLVILFSYGLANLVASFQISYQKRDLRYSIVMPLVFGMLHVGYGIGSIWGIIKLTMAPEFWKKLFHLGGTHASDKR